MKRRPFRLGISGSYGGLNLGDEGILESTISELRRLLPLEITVFSRNPKDTLARHAVERALPVRETARDEVLPEIERLDLFILGGGGILFDAEAKIYLREVVLALQKNVPVVVYGIGAGPLQDVSVQQVVKDCLDRAAAVSVRDRPTLRILEEAGVEREIKLTADPALLLKAEPMSRADLKRERLDGERRLVGVSVREPGGAAPDMDVDSYHWLLANAADYMIDRFDADVVFVPMEHHSLDIQHSHAVVAKMQGAKRATVLREEYRVGQLLSLVGHFDFAVGMRLHFLIFAALQQVPFVALPYAPKVEGFLQDMKMEMPPLRLVNTGRLISHIDRSWDRRETLRKNIQRVLPSLRERAQENNRLVARVLDPERIGAKASGQR